MTKINKHDAYVQDLCARLMPFYDKIVVNYCIFSKKCKVAEVDILAFRGNKVHVFEVKCSFRITKAKKQLQKIKKLLEMENISLFFYCGNANIMECVA